MEQEEELKCFTAPGKVFLTRDDLLAHYKSDWHHYNLKRKVGNLPPINEEVFNRVKEQLEMQKAELMNVGNKKKTDHLKVKSAKNPYRLAVLQGVKVTGNERDSEVASTNGTNTILDASSSVQDREDAEEDFFDFDEKEAKKQVENLTYTASLFELDDSPIIQFATINENLDFMQRTYGFFVPDKEYLVDVEGLLKYVALKISVGKLCLFCDRHFKTRDSVIQHMVSKNHCKIKTQLEETPEENNLDVDDVDYDEFAEFYDYSAMSSNVKSSVAKVEYLNTGELLFTNNDGSSRIIGNRGLRRFYAQNVRPSSEDESNLSVAMLANIREQRGRMQKLMASTGNNKLAVVENSNERSIIATRNVSSSEKVGRGEYALSKLFYKIERKALSLQKRRLHISSYNHLKLGLQGNLHVKNKTAKKNVGQGLGVHG